MVHFRKFLAVSVSSSYCSLRGMSVCTLNTQSGQIRLSVVEPVVHRSCPLEYHFQVLKYFVLLWHKDFTSLSKDSYASYIYLYTQHLRVASPIHKKIVIFWDIIHWGLESNEWEANLTESPAKDLFTQISQLLCMTSLVSPIRIHLIIMGVLYVENSGNVTSCTILRN